MSASVEPDSLWPCMPSPCPFVCDSQGSSMSLRVPAHHPFLRLTVFHCRDGPALQLTGNGGGLFGLPGHVAPSAQPLHHSPSLTLLPESLPEDDVFIRLFTVQLQPGCQPCETWPSTSSLLWAPAFRTCWGGLYPSLPPPHPAPRG